MFFADNLESLHFFNVEQLGYHLISVLKSQFKKNEEFREQNMVLQATTKVYEKVSKSYGFEIIESHELCFKEEAHLKILFN